VTGWAVYVHVFPFHSDPYGQAIQFPFEFKYPTHCVFTFLYYLSS
jgi:hypothetical protein